MIDKPIIREGDAVGVPTEVVEDLHGAGEGPLRIHDPVDGPELTEESDEGAPIRQIGGARREGQLRRMTRVNQTGTASRSLLNKKYPDQLSVARRQLAITSEIYTLPSLDRHPYTPRVFAKTLSRFAQCLPPIEPAASGPLLTIT